VKKLQVNETAYYQEQYENNGYTITPLTDHAILIWKEGDMVKCVSSLEDAKRWTNEKM
jgi:hypothetical protein